MDDRRPEPRAAAAALLDGLERELPFPGAARVGVTGSPGSGKSSLLETLVRALRERGETVGVLAVDPSSRQSGGALLGDRTRVRAGAGDAGVLFRSMAARDRLGGLADATRASVLVLAAVFDRVFVETVGVGQSEVDVADLVDTLVFVANPETGDVLQFMKAGVLELPDVFAVNKADLGGPARRTASELTSALGLAAREGDGATPRVLLTSARDGTGIADLVLALDDHRDSLLASGELRRRRDRGREAFVLDLLTRRYGSYGLERVGGRARVAARVRESREGACALGAALSREIEEALAKPVAG